MISFIDVVIGDARLASFRYGTPKGREKAVAKALAMVLEELLGSDVDPWPYVVQRISRNNHDRNASSEVIVS